ncbi:hypothetical protein BBP40_007380 [Aspergillus hancockii]|nr:hypothetical protein BBP40_007380 [Aspergillus hancockii]
MRDSYEPVVEFPARYESIGGHINPTPLNHRWCDSGGAQGNRSRRTVLVRGCGRGVDVLLLASFGYDAHGLGYSHSAIQACKIEAGRTSHRYTIKNPAVGRDSVTFVQRDFFGDSLLEALAFRRNAFDLVYDHSFFCALDPSICPEWALRQTQLLTVDGYLICLEYPRHRGTSEMGRPWPISSEDYWEYHTHAGEERSDPKRNRGGRMFVRVPYWKPDRTPEDGRDANILFKISCPSGVDET